MDSQTNTTDEIMYICVHCADMRIKHKNTWLKQTKNNKVHIYKCLVLIQCIYSTHTYAHQLGASVHHLNEFRIKWHKYVHQKILFPLHGGSKGMQLGHIVLLHLCSVYFMKMSSSCIFKSVHTYRNIQLS